MQKLLKIKRNQKGKRKSRERETPCLTWASAHPSQLAQQAGPLPPSPVAPSPSCSSAPCRYRGEVDPDHLAGLAVGIRPTPVPPFLPCGTLIPSPSLTRPSPFRSRSTSAMPHRRHGRQQCLRSNHHNVRPGTSCSSCGCRHQPGLR